MPNANASVGVGSSHGPNRRPVAVPLNTPETGSAAPRVDGMPITVEIGAQ
jgi:hypothetical protein